MDEVVRYVKERIGLKPDNLRYFLNKVFDEVNDLFNLCADYQRRATKIGSAFESSFKIIMETLFPNIVLSEKVELPMACMGGNAKADFAVLRDNSDKTLIAVFEAKGSADYIMCGGKRIELSRPGLMRTDTTKKAISNAYQVKRSYPGALFFIVSSHKPISGDAKCMLDLAVGDIVDAVVDVTNLKELEEMAVIIRESLSKIKLH